MTEADNILSRLDAIGRQTLAGLDLDACRALHEDLMRDRDGRPESVDLARALLRMTIAVQWFRHSLGKFRGE